VIDKFRMQNGRYKNAEGVDGVDFVEELEVLDLERVEVILLEYTQTSLKVELFKR